MNPLLAAFDFSVFPPINATLNGISTILLLTGFLLIKSGRRQAHQKVMTAALVSSALFLACYLVYHYSAGHTEFPKEYPVARRIYLAILFPHILLAVLNLPFIILLLVAALRGQFERHKRLARFTFPSWLFVSVTGVVIYFMVYQWFPPSSAPATPAQSRSRIPAPALSPGSDLAAASAEPSQPGQASEWREGDLVFTPATQSVRAKAGENQVAVFFRVENRGKHPIRIERLESGCQCLEVSIDLNPIPAKGEARITGVFDLSKVRDSTERKIAVTPEGRSRPLFLSARIEIDPLYELEPSLTIWTKGGEPVTKTVSFRVVREDPIHVLTVENKRPEVECQLVEVEAGRHYQLELTPTTTAQSLLGIVRLETDCELEDYARPIVYYSIQ